MSSLDTLQAQVAASNQAMASAAALITGLHQQLQAAIAAAKAGDNHAALDQLAADLANGTNALAQAVVANTDAASAAAPADPVAAAPADPAPVVTADPAPADPAPAAPADLAAPTA